MAFVLCTCLFGVAIGGNSPDAVARPRPASAAALELGTLLFFDPALSGNYKRSCASCHRPQKAFTDQRVTARAFVFTENLTVNTPTLLGVARQKRFFHDGRAGTLAAAIRSVLTNPAELNSNYDQVRKRLISSPEYVRRFAVAFGTGPSEATINEALITYLKSLTPTPQRRVRSLPDSLRAGARLFAQVRCTTCHAGPDLRDGKRHLVATGRWVKTPTLRNLTATPPYLSDGSAPTLEAALASPVHARQRQLTQAETGQLVQFLNAIPGNRPGEIPVLPTHLPAIAGAPPRRIGGSY